jgi:hypothetical protein
MIGSGKEGDLTLGSMRWETKCIIGFDMRRTEVTGVSFKDPKKMNWESYKMSYGLRLYHARTAPGKK